MFLKQKHIVLLIFLFSVTFAKVKVVKNRSFCYFLLSTHVYFYTLSSLNGQQKKWQRYYLKVAPNPKIVQRKFSRKF